MTSIPETSEQYNIPLVPSNRSHYSEVCGFKSICTSYSSSLIKNSLNAYSFTITTKAFMFFYLQLSLNNSHHELIHFDPQYIFFYIIIFKILCFHVLVESMILLKHGRTYMYLEEEIQWESFRFHPTLVLSFIKECELYVKF